MCTKSLRFEVVNVMAQPNSNDCGLFALANATAIVHKVEPCLCQWDVQKLRFHLLSCLEDGKLTPFPHEPRKVSFERKILRTVKEEVYCVCRMPNDPDIVIAMIRCNTCKELYHGGCIGVEVSEYTMKKKTWICNDCKKMQA